MAIGKDIWQEELRITRELQDRMAFIKRWVQRVHDKETSLAELLLPVNPTEEVTE